MKKAITIALLFIYAAGFAQNQNIKTGADTAAINALFKVADSKPPDSAIVLFDSMYRLSVEAQYADGAFRALITKGIKYSEKEDFDNYRATSLDALPWAEKSTIKDAVAWCYNNIGVSYRCVGDYDSAAKYYLKGMDDLNNKMVPPTHITVNIYNNLGALYFSLYQKNSARSYYYKAEAAGEAGNFLFQLAQTCQNLGILCTEANNTDSAFYWFNREYEIGKKISKKDIQASALSGICEVYVNTGEYTKAINLYKQVLDVAGDYYPYITASVVRSLGNVYFKMGDLKQAEKYLEKAIRYESEHNCADDYITTYQILSDVYEASGQTKKALRTMHKLLMLKDSLTGAEKTKAVSQMENRYKSAEKDRQLAQNQLLIAQQKNQIARKNLWIWGIAACFCIVFLTGLIVYSRSRNRQKMQQQLIKSLEQENTISILKGAAQGEDRERERMARELHDGIGGMVSAAMLQLQAIGHNVTAMKEVPAYTYAMNLLEEIGRETRKVAHDLMPDALLKQSVEDAVNAYCNSLIQPGLSIEFSSHGTFSGLHERFRLNLYRIVQELLKNIITHSGASRAQVQLLRQDNSLTVTVDDNGRGFDSSKHTDGMGLQNLRARVMSMSGVLSIESAEGHGTSVFIEFDLEKQ